MGAALLKRKEAPGRCREPLGASVCARHPSSVDNIGCAPPPVVANDALDAGAHACRPPLRCLVRLAVNHVGTNCNRPLFQLQEHFCQFLKKGLLQRYIYTVLVSCVQGLSNVEACGACSHKCGVNRPLVRHAMPVTSGVQEPSPSGTMWIGPMSYGSVEIQVLMPFNNRHAAPVILSRNTRIVPAHKPFYQHLHIQIICTIISVQKCVILAYVFLNQYRTKGGEP